MRHEYSRMDDLAFWRLRHSGHLVEWLSENDDDGALVAVGERCAQCKVTLRFDHPDSAIVDAILAPR
jgi:hypothetical protein